MDHNSEPKIGAEIAPEGAGPEWYLVHKTEFHGRPQREVSAEELAAGIAKNREYYAPLIEADKARRAKLTPQELEVEETRLEEELAWSQEISTALEAIQMVARKAGRYVSEEDVEAGLAPIEAKYAHLIEAEKARKGLAENE